MKTFTLSVCQLATCQATDIHGHHDGGWMMHSRLTVDPHLQENREAWADFDDYKGDFCGLTDIHNPHKNLDGSQCTGIMCDHGCNEMEF